MTTIKVNDIEYNIPTSWNDITIKQQIEISKVTDRDDNFKNIHLIATYTGIDMELVKKMNINQFKSILGLMSFLAQPIDNKVIGSFTFNGNEYFLADSILAGQTQDFLSIEGVLKKFSKNQTEALPYIIAIVAKKRGETLDSFDIWKRGEEFKELPYPIAQSIWFFFAITEKTLSINTEQSLKVQDQVMELSLTYSENTLKQLDGLVWYKRLLRTTLLLYIRSIRRDYRNFSTTIRSTYFNKNLKTKSKKSILSNLVKRVKNKFK